MPLLRYSGKLHRLVPSRFPAINLFEFARNAAELERLAIIDGYTNARLRNEIGEINRVPAQQQRFGCGYSAIMAAFTHIGHPSRFSNGSYGVYYAGKTINTALAEVSYHRARFMAASQEVPSALAMREYISRFVARVRSISIDATSHPQCLHPDPDRYGPAQEFGTSQRAADEMAIHYPSLRHNRGECFAVLRPDALQPALQGGHYELLWDGATIVARYRLARVVD
ncbi:RES family NAD+ phosphorylase [Reinekea sp.]|jgi:hypothetical protein|uniref:RES family NAD+ phosphorylase n=1 Tax=Reinekea sp. TaxID=1970455 RepID=UPI002A82136D|nr:RES family NAD+ phosphorylase [Reinekea sp.]